jgi:hypothetical protein
MNKGIHTMIFSKVGGKYASDSLFLAIRRQENDRDLLSLAFQEAEDAMASGKLEGCKEDHDDHDHGHRSFSGGDACIEAVKPGKNR